MDKTKKKPAVKERELREAPRLRVSFKILCETEGRPPLGGLAWNLSAKGVSMYSSRIAVRGQKVTLSFPDIPHSPRLKAMVVWFEPGHVDLFLVGFHFVNPSEADTKFIERVMSPDFYLENQKDFIR